MDEAIELKDEEDAVVEKVGHAGSDDRACGRDSARDDNANVGDASGGRYAHDD